MLEQSHFVFPVAAGELGEQLVFMADVSLPVHFSHAHFALVKLGEEVG